MGTLVRRLLAWVAPYKRHVPFFLILVLAANLLTINFTVPWGSVYEDNGIFFEIVAVNHIRFGLGVTKGQDLVDFYIPYGTAQDRYGIPGLSESAQFDYFLHGQTHPSVYGHHPPLLGLSIAAGFLVFGFHYWIVRLIPVLYSLAGLILFYFLLLYLFDPAVATFASLLYAFFPMFAYFGRDVAHEAPTLFWALVLATGYVHWLADPRRRWLALMAASIVVGGFYGWPMYFFSTMVFAIHWLAARRFDQTLALATMLPAVITFALVVDQLVWVLGGNPATLINAFTTRAVNNSAGAPAEAPVMLFDWLYRLRRLNVQGFGTWAELATPFALGFVYLRARAEGWSSRLRMLAIVFLSALIHVLVFRDGAYNHAYWQFYFLPFFAILLGWSGVSLTRRLLRERAQQAIALVGAGAILFGINWRGTAALYDTDIHRHFVFLITQVLPK
jgi:4-amino-4-deoxy-L-arabinose transferase-like glycosyltransferase